MRKLLTITILLATLISCSQGIEDYTCRLFGSSQKHYLTLDIKNNLWKLVFIDTETIAPLMFNGRISQKNDYYLLMKELDAFGSERLKFFYNRKENLLFANRQRSGDDINISYISSLENENSLYSYCK